MIGKELITATSQIRTSNSNKSHANHYLRIFQANCMAKKVKKECASLLGGGVTVSNSPLDLDLYRKFQKHDAMMLSKI
jgi:hypothetical protein